MKKFIIILSSIIIVLGAGLFGTYFYNTHLSDECELEAFSFKVPLSFKAEDLGTTGCCFKCFGEDLSIRTYNINTTIEAERNSVKDDDVIEFEDLEGTPYDGFVSTLKLYSDKNKVEIFGIFGTDTNYLVASCDCSPLKAKLIIPVIKEIAKSAKYKLDFHLADKPDVYDCEYLNVYTGPKYFYSVRKGARIFCSTKSDSQNYNAEVKYANQGDDIFSLVEGYAAADNYNKVFYPKLYVKIFDNGSSPVELADKEYNDLKEKSFKDVTLTRDQKNLFGFKCEHVYHETGSDEKGFCNEYYYFSNGKYTYHITAKYYKNADEADIQEMLDGITIKDIK